jgi:hypothetical protein
MSQTSIIAGALIVAFIVFITVRGDLPGYLQVLGVAGGGLVASTTGPGGVSVSVGGPSTGVWQPGQPCPPGGSGGLGTTCGGAPSGIPGDSGTHTPPTMSGSGCVNADGSPCLSMG